MIFFGLELMKNGMDPLGSMPKFLELFKKFEATNIHGVIFSAITGAVVNGATAVISRYCRDNHGTGKPRADTLQDSCRSGTR